MMQSEYLLNTFAQLLERESCHSSCGTICAKYFVGIFQQHTKRKIICSIHPLFVAPLGIALNVQLP